MGRFFVALHQMVASNINQRLREVRLREGIQPRTMAVKLGYGHRPGDYLILEDPQYPLTVDELLACRRALDVPLSELLDVDDLVPLQTALLRAYKSAQSLRRTVKAGNARVMVDRLIADLLAAMPQMEEVNAWPVVGKRRSADELSARELNPVSSLYFSEEPTLQCARAV